MKFKKIVLSNFRQFKGENIIEFSTDNDHNITMVFGRNTYGKTTLLQAFNWVLYNNVNLQNPNQLLNIEVKNEMNSGDDADVNVTLYLDDVKVGKYEDNLEYLIHRKQTYHATPNGDVIQSGGYLEVKVKRNDTWEFVDDMKEVIDEILPESLSSYFFFDGERIDAISREQTQGRKEVGDSVKSILGLEHFSTAIKHLTDSSNCVEKELTSRLNSSTMYDLEDLRKEINSIDEEINNKSNSIETYNNEINKLEIERDAKNKQIENNKETYHKQQRKEQLKQNQKTLEEKKEQLLSTYRRYFNDYYLDFFYYGLNEKISKLTSSGILDQKTEAVPNMHANSIKYLIDRGYCICGEPIIENDEHYSHLIEEMKKLPPQSIGSSIRDFKRDISILVSEEKANNFNEEINEKFGNIRECDRDLEHTKDEIEKISDEIQTDVDVGHLEQEVREIEYRIREYTKKIGSLESEINELKNRKQRKEDEVKSKAQFDEKNKKVLKEIEYTKKLSNILIDDYRKKEKELISTLQTRINYYLGKIYSGERRIEITPDYRFKLVYREGDEDISSESEGLGTIKAISFMCGLLDVAKEKIVDDDDEKYPLVFDAPLSKLDSIHRKNVMECLPSVASQVIIFISEEKDLDDISENTRNMINKQYGINKINEIHSEIYQK